MITEKAKRLSEKAQASGGSKMSDSASASHDLLLGFLDSQEPVVIVYREDDRRAKVAHGRIIALDDQFLHLEARHQSLLINRGAIVEVRRELP